MLNVNDLNTVCFMCVKFAFINVFVIMLLFY